MLALKLASRVSSAGTNFLARSRALEEAGWSPDYTLTEDYALGMNMKKFGWKCRYVSEVLAIGEAPEQVRNCFQQRSRWSKVRFSSSRSDLIRNILLPISGAYRLAKWRG